MKGRPHSKFELDFMHKAKSTFCHAYMVNRFEEQAENLCSWVKHQTSAFWWLEIDQVRDSGDMKLKPTLVKIVRSILCN